MTEDTSAGSIAARLAREIRRVRRAAGLSQQQLATQVGYTRQYVSLAERTGRNLPSLELVRALDARLGTGGYLLNLREQARGEQRDLRLAATTSVCLPQFDHAGDISSDLAGQSDSGIVEQDAQDAARFARDLAGSRICVATLDQLERDVHRFSVDYVSRPLADLFAEIRVLRRNVIGLLQDNRFPNQLRQLYREASRTSGLQAHVCLDLGDYRAAHVHAKTAFLCADLADHHGMRAWVRSLQSLIAYWDRQYDDAVMFARDGHRFPASGSITARLPGLEARACAAQGDRNGTVSALDRAEQARAAQPTDDEAGVFTFPVAKQAVYAGTALLTLRDRDSASRAISQSSIALELYEATPQAERSSGDILAARLDLAAAHLLRDELDGADNHLRIVLSTPPERRTASIRKRANDICTQLSRSRFASSRQGHQLTAEVSAFCAQRPAHSDGSPA